MASKSVKTVRALERLAVVYYRLGRLKDVEKTVSMLVPLAKDNAHALMMCAHLRLTIGEFDSALPLAYRALGLGADQADLHFGYIGVMHAIPDDRVTGFDVEVVGIDTAVSLEINGESVTYVIVADGEQRFWPDEHSASSSIAAALLGRRQGDTVTLRPGPLGRRDAQIRVVQHKYVARYQTVLNDFNRRFPDADGLWKFKGDTGAADVKRLLDLQAERIQEAMAAYERREVPVGVLARLVGRSPLETWRTLVGNPAYRPFVRPHSQEALDRAVQALQEREGIVLDPTAALTLFGLDLLDSVQQYHRAVYVAQTVVDAVSKEIDQHRALNPDRPVMVTFKEGDTYYRNEISPEQSREFLSSLERLREQLRGLTIVGRPSDSPIHGNARLAEVLGVEFTDAAAIANAQGLVLISDDLLFRELCGSEWKIHSASSFDLLAYATSQGQLEQDSFERSALRMVRWNFRHIPIRARTIVLALRTSGYDVDSEVNVLLDILADPEIDLRSAARVGGGAIKDLWLTPILPHKLHAVVGAILYALVRSRGPQILSEVKGVLAVLLRLAPQHLRVVEEFIDGFAKRRFRGEIVSE